MLLTAGCGGSGGASSGSSSQASAQPTQTPPKISTFDEFPGKELKHFRAELAPLGLRVKGIDSMWTPELLGKSADVDRHYLAVYVAVTSEEKDRGTQHVNLDGLTLRMNSRCPKPDSDPRTSNGGGGDGKSCSYYSSLFSELKSEVYDGRWRSMYWTYEQLHFDDVAAGETRIGVVGFDVSDEAHGTFELCAPGIPDDPNDRYSFGRPSCVPIPQPKNAR
jgi:hypothetical protein